jgi:hypothetical protein
MPHQDDADANLALIESIFRAVIAAWLRANIGRVPGISYFRGIAI